MRYPIRQHKSTPAEPTLVQHSQEQPIVAASDPSSRAPGMPTMRLSTLSTTLRQLQQGRGNRYVQGLMEPISTTANPASAPVIQTKSLTLGPANDKYEREADRVAQQVVGHDATQAATLQPPVATPTVMRRPAMQGAEGGAVDTGVQQAIQSARGRGQTLPNGVRTSMEQALGADFRNVRLHTSAQADALNQSLQARAFTTGQDIFFRRGAYNPNGQSGRQILAHELTHVVQQGAANAGAVTTQALNQIQRSHIKSHKVEGGGPVPTPNAKLAELDPRAMLRLVASERLHKTQGTADAQAPLEPEEFDKLWQPAGSYPLTTHSRAKKVVAIIEGDRRMVGGRMSASLQPQVGNLGEQERAILGRHSRKSYEGGHLIADRFLDQASYEPWNLAPLARELNGTQFQFIENIIAAGLRHKKTKQPNLNIPIEMSVEVKYPSPDPYSVTVDELQRRVVIAPQTAQRAKAAGVNTVAINRFVPDQWIIQAEIPAEYQGEYEFPEHAATETARKNMSNEVKPALRRQGSQAGVLEAPDARTVNDALVMGGGSHLAVTAYQHYPDPTTPAYGGDQAMVDWQAQAAFAAQRRSVFDAPFNILKLHNSELATAFTNTLSQMDLNGNPQDLTSWVAVARYIKDAIPFMPHPNFSRQDLFAAASRKYSSEASKNVFVQWASAPVLPASVKEKLTQILLRDSYVKLSDEDLQLEQQLPPAEYTHPQASTLKLPLTLQDAVKSITADEARAATERANQQTPRGPTEAENKLMSSLFSTDDVTMDDVIAPPQTSPPAVKTPKNSPQPTPNTKPGKVNQLANPRRKIADKPVGPPIVPMNRPVNPGIFKKKVVPQSAPRNLGNVNSQRMNNPSRPSGGGSVTSIGRSNTQLVLPRTPTSNLPRPSGAPGANPSGRTNVQPANTPQQNRPKSTTTPYVDLDALFSSVDPSIYHKKMTATVKTDT